MVGGTSTRVTPSTRPYSRGWKSLGGSGRWHSQPQNNEPPVLTFAQKNQLLNKFCTAEAGGPYDVSEAALLECKTSYYVTDQGQILPR